MSGVDDDKYIDIDSGERVQIVSQQIYQVILLKENVSRVDGGDLEKITDSANLRKVFNYISILHKLEILKSEFHAKPLILSPHDSSKSRTTSAFSQLAFKFFKQARDFDV